MAEPVDLIDMMESQMVECLNQKPEHPVGNALKQVFLSSPQPKVLTATAVCSSMGFE